MLPTLCQMVPLRFPCDVSKNNLRTEDLQKSGPYDICETPYVLGRDGQVAPVQHSGRKLS